MQGTTHIKEELERAKTGAGDGAPRAGSAENVRTAVRPKIPELEQQLADAAEAELKDTQLLRNRVTEEEIAEVVSKWTGIPVAKMLEGEKGKAPAHGRRAAFKARRSARTKRSSRYRTPSAARALDSPTRIGPTARSCSSGPTGVGKTELSKALAEFPVRYRRRADSRRTCRSSWRSTPSRRLIGAPPGYVGYEEGGYLTEAVRRKPYSVILLDEVEKAHPDVFNVLLQVLDDGRLTDGHGRTVDFRNTVVIMTSNHRVAERIPGTCGRRELRRDEGQQVIDESSASTSGLSS